MKKDRWLYFLVSLMLIIMSGMLSCVTTGSRPIDFRTLTDTQSWRIGEGSNYLVVTEKNWSSFYSKPPASANFASNIYFVASLGTKPNPSYTIKLSSISQVGDEIKISLELGEPEPGKFYPQVIVYRIIIAEVAKSQLPQGKLLNFVFVDQNETSLAKVKAEI
jgi:hypothetical protein